MPERRLRKKIVRSNMMSELVRDAFARRRAIITQVMDVGNSSGRECDDGRAW